LKDKRTRRILAFSISLGTAEGFLLIQRFPPAQYSFYPRCPFAEYLHLLCPGCGATRALAAVLSGHIAEALHWNALFVSLLPVLAGYAALCCYRLWTADEFLWPEPPNWTVQTGFVITLVFTVTRNLPR